MSGETEDAVSGWTVDTLHAHMERLVREHDRRYEQRFDAQEKAILKSETSYDKRFEGVNEFRATLADQARDLMPRKESELQHAAVIERVATVETLMRAQVARGVGLKDGWGYLAGVVGVLVGVVGLVIAATR